MGFWQMEMLEEGISENILNEGMDVGEAGVWLKKHAQPSLPGA